MTPDDKIYVNYLPTIGQFDTKQTSSGLVPGTTPAPNATPAANETVNEIVANRGRIGGWIIQNGMLKGGNFVIHSDGYIDINNGELFIDGDSSFIALGSTSGNYIRLDGANRKITVGTNSVDYIKIDGATNTITVGPTSGDYITIDGANQRIRSSNYSTGVSGFTVEPDLVEAQNIRARGVLQSAVFQKDVISAVGGQLMIANADVLDVDMTTADNSTLTVKGDTTFALNDILRIKDATNDEWFRVTNIGSAPTYTVTRDLGSAYSANSNPAWKAGQAVVKQGKSDGASTYSGGWLQLFGEGTNSPYYSVFQRTGVAYNAITEVVRLGNLNGIGGQVAETYGIFIGDYSNKYLMYDVTSSELVVSGTISATSAINAPITRSYTLGQDMSVSTAVYLANGNTHAIDLESSSSQLLYVTDGFAGYLAITGDISIEAWIKPETINGTIASRWDESGSFRSWWFSVDSSGKLSFYVSSDGTTNNGSYQQYQTSSIVVNAGTYYHVAVTFNIGTETCIFYVDGSVVTSSKVAGTTLGATLHNPNVNFRIGAKRGAASEDSYFDGLIDDVRIWNDVRTATEIANNRAIEIGTETNLKGYWKLNNALTDSSGGGNTLTNSGAAVFSTTIPTFTTAIYKTSASASGTANGFVGFVQTAGSSVMGSTVSVVIAGIASGFSGLTLGSLYYLSDTSGLISTSAGTVTRKVGIAVSTTEVLITNIW